MTEELQEVGQQPSNYELIGSIADQSASWFRQNFTMSINSGCLEDPVVCLCFYK